MLVDCLGSVLESWSMAGAIAQLAALSVPGAMAQAGRQAGKQESASQQACCPSPVAALGFNGSKAQQAATCDLKHVLV